MKRRIASSRACVWLCIVVVIIIELERETRLNSCGDARRRRGSRWKECQKKKVYKRICTHIAGGRKIHALGAHTEWYINPGGAYAFRPWNGKHFRRHKYSNAYVNIYEVSVCSCAFALFAICDNLKGEGYH